VAQIATTIARPDRGYGGTYNYFDPDNFISLTAMIYSNNKYLQDQAIRCVHPPPLHTLCVHPPPSHTSLFSVVKRSGQFLKTTGDKFNGQLPHHFQGTTPTFTALSGATQTGPNTFWTKTALQVLI
jgi:hypothetical protein